MEIKQETVNAGIRGEISVLNKTPARHYYGHQDQTNETVYILCFIDLHCSPDLPNIIKICLLFYCLIDFVFICYRIKGGNIVYVGLRAHK
jgi:hypothetical protein